MNWWQPENFDKRRTHLKTRSEIIKGIRTYFDALNFTEVQTPVLQTMPAPDTHIHAFKTTRLGHNLKPLKTLGLHTSPEIAMKKLLVAGMENIYQICPVFRNAEEGTSHSCEFTMLEWYRTNTNYTAMMDDCEWMIKSLGISVYKSCNVMGTWERLSVTDAFKHYADIDLPSVLGDIGAFKKVAGVRTTDIDTWEDIFHAVMAEKIEPHLGAQQPTILHDYPVSMAALARKCLDPRFAERFELYISGVELANAYSELTDPKEQRARLNADLAQKKALYGTESEIDEDFLRALEHGMPECSGCALGVDRLVMLATKAETIDEVLWTTKP